MPTRSLFILAIGALLFVGCMETAPIPDWVQGCVDAQNDPSCVPADVRSEPGPSAD